MLEKPTRQFYLYDNVITSQSFRAACDGVRQSLRALGVGEARHLVDLLSNSVFSCSGVGGYFGAEALDECARLRHSAHIHAAVAMQLSVERPPGKLFGKASC